MRIAEFMSKEVRTVAPSDPAELVWNQMRLARIRHVVVVDNGALVGIVSDADLGGPHGESVRRGTLVSELMNPHVITARTDTTVREAANLMRGHSTDCVVVLKNVRVTGIITATDLLELLGRGAQRPVGGSERRILKDRGNRPHGQVAAKLAHQAKRPVSR